MQDRDLLVFHYRTKSLRSSKIARLFGKSAFQRDIRKTCQPFRCRLRQRLGIHIRRKERAHASLPNISQGNQERQRYSCMGARRPLRRYAILEGVRHLDSRRNMYKHEHGEDNEVQAC